MFTRLRKVRQMSTREISFRVRQRLQCLRERRLYRRGAGLATRAYRSNRTLRQAAGSLLPGYEPGEWTQLASVQPDLYRNLQNASHDWWQRFRQQGATLFDIQVPPSELENWHQCPKSGYRFPAADFHADVSIYELPGETDVKYVWESGRHQYLAELGRVFFTLGEPLAAETARQLLRSWIRENPALTGVHWTSALEVAMRSISWIWTLAAISQWPEWTNEDEQSVVDSLIEHAEYLRCHLSFYSSPYNHLIGEATALYLLGNLLADHPQAEAWLQTGRQILRDHGPRQFSGDGFTVEQATGYHFYTLGFLCLARAMSRSKTDDLVSLDPVLSRAFRAGLVFQQPDARWPAVGDVDSARSIPVTPVDAWDFRSLYAVAAIQFEEPLFRFASEHVSPEAYWLYGAEAVERWNQVPCGQDHVRQSVLPESGYAAIRTAAEGNSDWLLFDCGPLAAGLHADRTPSVAHGHDDTLSVMYHHAGRPALIDSGMPTYAGKLDRVNHFRDAAAHNTFRVVEAPLARHAGRLAWHSVVPNGRLQAEWQSDVHRFCGRVPMNDGTCLERQVLHVTGDGIWIADRIHRRAGAEVVWHWQLGPAFERPRWRISDGPNRILESSDGTLQMCMAASGDFTTELLEARTSGFAGWRSECYGTSVAGQCLRIRARHPGSELLMLTFVGDQISPARFATESNSVGWADTPPFPEAWDAASTGFLVSTGRGLVSLPLTIGSATEESAQQHLNWKHTADSFC